MAIKFSGRPAEGAATTAPVTPAPRGHTAVPSANQTTVLASERAAAASPTPPYRVRTISPAPPTSGRKPFR